MPPSEVAPNCRDYAATVRAQPGFNRSLLTQAVSTATASQGPASAECLAICALEAVQEREWQQLQRRATLTHDQDLKSAFHGEAYTSRRSSHRRRGMDGIDRRQQKRSSADQKPRTEEQRSGAVSSKVIYWAWDIQRGLGINKRVCFMYLQTGRSCASHRSCTVVPCMRIGKQPARFCQAEQQEKAFTHTNPMQPASFARVHAGSLLHSVAPSFHSFVTTLQPEHGLTGRIQCLAKNKQVFPFRYL